MKKTPISGRLRYAFDNVMSRGIIGLIAWLALISVSIVLVTSVIVWLTHISAEQSLAEQFWVYLADTVDAVPMTDRPWPHRLPQLVITYTGLFVTGALIGILTSGMSNRFEELRKGRSKVLETNHTVILGWSPKVCPILSELVIANANKANTCIVVLGNKDKVDMEDEIRDKIGDTGRTGIVCRRGDPTLVADLEIVSLATAKAIIVLAPESDDPDASVIKTMLAIRKDRAESGNPCHIVAEIHHRRNMEVARIVGRDDAELLFTSGLVARIMAQTCRQSGLPAIYTELLNFAGDEIYFRAEPGLVGKNFGEALLAYEDSLVIGLYPKNGTVKLNPLMSTRIEEGDRIIAISKDDDTIKLSGLRDLKISRDAIQAAPPVEPAPEHILILGWNRRATSIINELDSYAAPGSTVTVVGDSAGGQDQIERCCADLKNQTVTFRKGDTTDRRILDGLSLETCKHVILLAYADDLDTQQADAHTLITLLHLRDIADRTGNSFSIVSEMLDIRNRDLAEVERADDFVVSDRLISMVLSQISENKALGGVFADLFDPSGSEIYLKPAESYVKLGEPVNFYTIVEPAQRRSEVALGYRRNADANDAAKRYGVVINPKKSVPVTFEAGDKIIVLAEK